ncbi:glycosyltransferase [Pedobacter arcticus]|uniref:glycosyltransferase n=1 Tax=Pedobacter arcticus TaxID=752140 RepID=UPI00030812FC|nr:glycosyltransferase family 4 protein [Pedobacter arcticus]
MIQAQAKLLIIGSVWPEPNSSAAGIRMLQLIEVFSAHHYQITFASATADSEFAVNLADYGVEKVNIKLNHHSFDDFISELNPTIVLFDRFITEEQYGWRVSENCPHALKVLDTEDLHCLRAARHKAWKLNQTFNIRFLLKEDIAKREIASVLRCDLSLMISTFEMEVLSTVFNTDSSLLLYLPFMLNGISNAETQHLPSFEERTNFISIGNFLHEPNWQSVLNLKNHIWPLIRKALPKAELHVYGAYPSAKVLQLNNPKDGFLIKGRAVDVASVMQTAKVCLAPLLFGAGLKGKLIDAMQNGAPNITTAIGAEGMHQNLAWSGIIAEGAESFANAAVSLYNEKQTWLNAQKNGFEIINQVYPKVKYANLLMNTINQLLKNLELHRQQNFYGAMLQHHTLASTKYLAKWIQEKNK